MRLLAFSDLHRAATTARAIVAASAGAHVVIAAGDFATRRHGLADTLDILREMTVPTILVAGNHDELHDLRSACAGWSHGNVLHGEGFELAGTRFFGLGFEIGGSNDAPWNSRMSEIEAAAALAACPHGAVLVTHAPPFGVADLQASGSHAIRSAIDQKRPRLHLCGHIHHSWGVAGMIGACPVHNLGPRLNWFNI